METRGERDEERRADGGGEGGRREGGREGGGESLEYLSLALPRFLPLRAMCLWCTGVMRKTPLACLASGK